MPSSTSPCLSLINKKAGKRNKHPFSISGYLSSPKNIIYHLERANAAHFTAMDGVVAPSTRGRQANVIIQHVIDDIINSGGGIGGGIKKKGGTFEVRGYL